jgi:Tol biopolymer transport system component
MLTPVCLRIVPKLLAACAMLALAAAFAHAQNPGGPPESIVFVSAGNPQPNNQIYTMNPNGTDPDRVTFDTASNLDPDISPDGKYIVFTSNQTGNNDIYIMDRRSGSAFDLTNNPANDEWARFSPDGKQIVFDSNRDGGVFEVFVMNADGSGTPTQLTFPPTLSRYPSWSPDGKQIIFRHGIDLYVMNSDGSGTPTQLTNEVPPSFAQMANFSPNGRRVTFMSFREGYCSVFLMNSDGSEPTNLTPKDPADPSTSWCSRAPAWSANGREIYFMSFRPSTGGLNQVFVMNTDGSNLQQLTSTGTNGEPRARRHSPDK